MDWQAQAHFLENFPQLHSLLAAYIAIDDSDSSALNAFVQENSTQVVHQTLAQLSSVLQADHQAWWLASKLAGVEINSQNNDEPKKWLTRLEQDLKQALTTYP